MEKKMFNDVKKTVFIISSTQRLHEKILDYLNSFDELRIDTLSVDKEVASNFQPTSIFVKEQDYFRRIDFQLIRWIEASGSYCFLHLDKGRKLIISFNLTELSAYLPVRQFLRVHRSYIVNINYIDSFIGNSLCIDEKYIPISKQHKKEVVTRLNILGNIR